MIDRFQTTIHRNLLLDRTIGSWETNQKQEYLLFYSIKRKNKNNEKIIQFNWPYKTKKRRAYMIKYHKINEW